MYNKTDNFNHIKGQWIKDIRGYIDRGKFSLIIRTSFIGHLVSGHERGGVRLKRVDGGFVI